MSTVKEILTPNLISFIQSETIYIDARDYTEKSFRIANELCYREDLLRERVRIINHALAEAKYIVRILSYIDDFFIHYEQETEDIFLVLSLVSVKDLIRMELHDEYQSILFVWNEMFCKICDPFSFQVISYLLDKLNYYDYFNKQEMIPGIFDDEMEDEENDAFINGENFLKFDSDEKEEEQLNFIYFLVNSIKNSFQLQAFENILKKYYQFNICQRNNFKNKILQELKKIKKNILIRKHYLELKNIDENELNNNDKLLLQKYQEFQITHDENLLNEALYWTKLRKNYSKLVRIDEKLTKIESTLLIKIKCTLLNRLENQKKLEKIKKKRKDLNKKISIYLENFDEYDDNSIDFDDKYCLRFHFLFESNNFNPLYSTYKPKTIHRKEIVSILSKYITKYDLNRKNQKGFTCWNYLFSNIKSKFDVNLVEFLSRFLTSYNFKSTYWNSLVKSITNPYQVEVIKMMLIFLKPSDLRKSFIMDFSDCGLTCWNLLFSNSHNKYVYQVFELFIEYLTVEDLSNDSNLLHIFFDSITNEYSLKIFYLLQPLINKKLMNLVSPGPEPKSVWRVFFNNISNQIHITILKSLLPLLSRRTMKRSNFDGISLWCCLFSEINCEAQVDAVELCLNFWSQENLDEMNENELKIWENFSHVIKNEYQNQVYTLLLHKMLKIIPKNTE